MRTLICGDWICDNVVKAIVWRVMVRSCYKGYILGLLLIMLVVGSCSTSQVSESGPSQITPSKTIPQFVPVFTYQVINTFPHDRKAWTEGLIFNSGILYEGTGLSGRSSLRKVELETGKIVQLYRLPEQYYGEGITAYKDTIIQLTWKSNTGLVYNKNSFALQRQFSYVGEGWGLTNDGTRLIMSNGSSSLTFLDSENFTPISHIKVHDGNDLVYNLNELEYVKDKIFANVWRTDKIAIIEPSDGKVVGWVDLNGLLQTQPFCRQVDVLNGIAYDAQTDRLFVTGKFWPFLFEIKLVEKS
ncbi:glutaminyl-peptide cyclotransferase [Chloroflexota bacterium]